MKNDKRTQLNNLMKQHGYWQASPFNRDESARFNGTVSDREGKMYFIKAAYGKGSYKYKSLYRESQVTRYFSNLTKETHLSHKGYELRVPTVIKIIEQDGIFCLITDYIEGKKLSDESSQTQANILLITLGLVSKLSEVQNISTMKAYLKNYTRTAILFSLPMRFTKATFFFPFVFPGLIGAFWKGASLLFHNINEDGFVHPDINVTNIIFYKNAIYLTDWEEAGWGISAYNTIGSLSVHWQDQVLREMLLNRLEYNGQKKITIPLLAYRALVLFNQHAERKNKKRKRDIMVLKFLEKI